MVGGERKGMRRRTNPPAPAGSKSQAFHNQPFRNLAKVAGQAPKVSARDPGGTRPNAETPPPTLNDADLFRREMEGVRPLAPDERLRVSPRVLHRAETTPASPDAEALAELSDLVTGAGPFDITNTSEYIEGSVIGLDPRVVRRLGAGEFSYQSHLDLHGLTTAEARPQLERFLTNAHQRGYRCVLIIHGRGLNSENQEPVLKKRVSMWLARGAFSRLVLAFTSARVCDGGAGALYVLLRRRREAKRAIRVTEGSKW